MSQIKRHRYLQKNIVKIKQLFKTNKNKGISGKELLIFSLFGAVYIRSLKIS